MSGYPTVAGVVSHLRDIGQPVMADVVARLAESERTCRQQMALNLPAYYALQDKYEPRPKAEPFVNWTGD